MYYFIYKTTNKINNKYYIGAHKTEDLNDNYLGSGTILKRAINKYGKENFTREILEECDSDEQLYALEAKYVSDYEIHDKNCYNIKHGGQGGFDYINMFYNPCNNLKHKSRDWADEIMDSIIDKK